MRTPSGRTRDGGDLPPGVGHLATQDLLLAAAISGKDFDSLLATLRRPNICLHLLAEAQSVAQQVTPPTMLVPGGSSQLPRFLHNLMSAVTGGSRPLSEPSPTIDAGGGTAMRPARPRGTPQPRPNPTGAGTDTADPEELHQLVLEHGDAIYRLALSVVRDRSLAEDIAQETLIKAWLALPSFRGDSSLRGWILRITHNTAISTIRRRRAVVIDPHDMPETPVKAERSVESRVQGGVVMDDFVQALDLLDDLSRSIIVLRELEGLSYEEIGDVLDVPLPTVKTRLLRARRKLGAALREWE